VHHTVRAWAKWRAVQEHVRKNHIIQLTTAAGKDVFGCKMLAFITATKKIWFNPVHIFTDYFSNKHLSHYTPRGRLGGEV
jgi:hypothetical protein